MSEKTKNCYYRKFGEYLKASELDSVYEFKYSNAVSVLLAGYVVDYDAYTYEKTEVEEKYAPWYRIILDGYDFWVYGGYVVVKIASVQKNIEFVLTEGTSYIYKAYKENRYDLFSPLNKAGYIILLRDKSGHPATVFKYIVDDNNLKAAKALVESGYGINDTENVFLDNEYVEYIKSKGGVKASEL